MSFGAWGCWNTAMPFSALMFLHRGHFMQALRDNPADPLNSAYRESFHTAYDCACAILNSTKEHYDKQPNFVPRVWRIWTNAFCAAVDNNLLLSNQRSIWIWIYLQVIIGTTAVNYIGVNLDPAPLQKLEDACALFERMDITSSSASGLLVIFTLIYLERRLTNYFR